MEAAKKTEYRPEAGEMRSEAMKRLEEVCRSRNWRLVVFNGGNMSDYIIFHSERKVVVADPNVNEKHVNIFLEKIT